MELLHCAEAPFFILSDDEIYTLFSLWKMSVLSVIFSLLHKQHHYPVGNGGNCGTDRNGNNPCYG